MQVQSGNRKRYKISFANAAIYIGLEVYSMDVRIINMAATLEHKVSRLRRQLEKSGRLIVAFSGGVDSALLAYLAKVAVGEKVLAVTVVSRLFSNQDKRWAKALAKRLKISHIFLRLVLPTAVINNSVQRCYFCKGAVFSLLKRYAKKNGYTAVLEGSNLDDLRAFRPGSRALKELNIQSPLRSVGFTKKDIRMLSKKFGLASWDRPASPCLATRVAYGIKLTAGRLILIEKAEAYLRRAGFRQVRVRLRKDGACIEVEKKALASLKHNKDIIFTGLKARGLAKVGIDPQGYRSGSMDEDIIWTRKKS